MKNLKMTVLAAALMLVMLPVIAHAGELGRLRLSYIEGDVQIKSEDSSEWLPVSVNMPLREGDSLWVPDRGRLEIQTSGGSRVRLDEMTSLDVLNIDSDSYQFYLAEGSAYINFRGARESLLQIDTPVSSSRSYDRAAFNIDVARNGDTELSVYRGSVYAETADGRTKVASGNTLEIWDDYADLSPLGRADEWERWNTDRDRRLEERRYSSGYLPDELEAYAGDFDDNGRWVNLDDYGYVWIPTVGVAIDWSPYRNGRWCWIGNDYVWVGYEPWGWAPYHFGRWAHSRSHGWFWVPPARGDVFWGPGYVGWVRTPTYVAWVPLAPRETYYGYGNYGRHSVNLINININTVVIKHKYRNARVSNGYTALHNDTFVRGRNVDLKLRDNPFERGKIHIGRPDIKPERESRMAVVREIPKSKEPPQKIREVKIKEIKRERPLVKEKERTVFRHDRPEKQLKITTQDAPRERKKDRSEERSRQRDNKQRDNNIKGQDRQRPEERKDERKKETAPSDRGVPDERKARPQDSPGIKRTEPGGSPAGASPVDRSSPKMREGQTGQQERKPVQTERQDIKTDRPGKRDSRPSETPTEQPRVKPAESRPVQTERQDIKTDRPGKRDSRPSETPTEQPKVKPAESRPVQDRQQKREEPQQKMPEKKAEGDKQKEKQKKVRDEKERPKPAPEGIQPPVERGGPAVR